MRIIFLLITSPLIFRISFIFYALLLSCIISSCNYRNAAEKSSINELAIEVKDFSREFFFTNKIAGFYYGETNSQAKNGWQGWTVNAKRVFNDYSIFLDTAKLDRPSAVTQVFPYKLTRDYPNEAMETFFLADSLDLILIKLSNIDSDEITFNLHKFSSLIDYATKSNTAKLKTDNFTLYVQFNSKIINIVQRESDCSIVFQSKDEILISLSLDSAITPTAELFSRHIDKKRKRLENLLADSFVKTNDDEFGKALAWNKITLDALIMHQGMKGIYAGLPWFNNYWGRDTFISLPGATLTQGNLKDAREILLAFANEQDGIPSSKFFGRIPNRITLKEKIYNTADGTPWFIIQAYKYIKASGDLEFLEIVYPNIVTAMNSAIKNSVDENYFLIHDEAETWMDAVGPNGPWSPRGNRANDIQLLWYQQLKLGIELAKLLNDGNNIQKWSAVAEKLKFNIKKYFIDTANSIIYDHLNEDNSVDFQIRPNQFFLLNESDFFDSYETRLQLLSSAVSKLVYPYGVLSLSQEDSDFHPYHHYKPYYVQDAAYHNGLIWLWNFGPVISALQSFHFSDLAFTLTEELVRQTLNEGCIGALSELTDAFPRENEERPQLSGTFAQAWSMAEFIRNFYEDYLGVERDALTNSLYLLPSLPEKLSDVNFRTRIGNSFVNIRYLNDKQNFTIDVDAAEVIDSIDIGISVLNRINTNFFAKFSLNRNETAKIIINHFSDHNSGFSLSVNGQPKKVNTEVYKDPSRNLDLYKSVKFAQPRFNTEWTSIKKINYRILTNKEIKQFNSDSELVLTSSKKTTINFGYSYPLNSNFKPGILNCQQFELRRDADNYYFKLKFENLHDPGWHPEYGFQLTFAAIAIQTENFRTGSVNIGLNSNHQLPKERYFNKLIVVGGGLEIKNDGGRFIAAYFPNESDVKNPLGNVNSNEITFSIPKDLIGDVNSNSKLTILIGAQDDHGGAGIGEFRSVNETASEWLGGGKTDPKAPNTYQVIKLN